MRKTVPQTPTLAIKTTSFKSLDLLPDEFHDEVETTRVRGLWILALSLLLIALGNLFLTDWLRIESARRYADLLQVRVEPIIKIRDAAREQIALNETLDRWINYVESARPDDSLLQTLAAVTTAITPHAHETLVDCIDIRLATELARGDTDTAGIANETSLATTSSLVIDARLTHPEASQVLLQRLQEQSRIDGITIQSHDANDHLPRFEIRGVPRATRILP